MTKKREKAPLPEFVWEFDGNHRVYRPLTDEERATGRMYSRGGPIYREYWRKRRVVGETQWGTR